MSSPAQRSLELMRKEGCLAGMVERWNTFAGPPDKICPLCRKNQVGVRQDLFGFADILAVNPKTKETFFIQTTDATSVARHRLKLAASPEVNVCLAAGAIVELHGWRKNAKGRYVVNRERFGTPSSNSALTPSFRD